jgi:hypothetical protein
MFNNDNVKIFAMKTQLSYPASFSDHKSNIEPTSYKYNLMEEKYDKKWSTLSEGAFLSPLDCTIGKNKISQSTLISHLNTYFYLRIYQQK